MDGHTMNEVDVNYFEAFDIKTTLYLITGEGSFFQGSENTVVSTQASLVMASATLFPFDYSSSLI